MISYLDYSLIDLSLVGQFRVIIVFEAVPNFLTAHELSKYCERLQ